MSRSPAVQACEILPKETKKSAEGCHASVLLSKVTSAEDSVQHTGTWAEGGTVHFSLATTVVFPGKVLCLFSCANKHGPTVDQLCGWAPPNPLYLKYCLLSLFLFYTVPHRYLGV